MKVQKKTKEELIKDLNELQLKYDAITLSIAANTSRQLERYNSLLINLEAGVVIHKSDSTIIYSNPKAEELLGLSKDQMQGKLAIDPEWKFFDENNLPLAFNRYPVNQIISSKKEIKNFLVGVHRPSTNDLIWLTVNGFPSFDNSNEITEIVISFMDITNHKNLENKLLNLSEFKETLISSLQDGYAIVNGDGIQTQVNQSFCKMTGFTDEELVGTKAPFPYWPTEEYENINAAFQKTLNEEEARFELIFVRKNGERFPVSVAPVTIKNKQGEVISFAATITDITKSKKAEVALKEKEERYRILVEHAPEALVVIDLETRKFVSVSQTAVELFKMSKEELLNSGIMDISPEYQPDGSLSSVSALKKISLALEGGKPSFEWMHKDSAGKLIPCEVILVRLPFEKKMLVRGSVRDISERKKAEQQQQVQFTIAQALSQSETIEECAANICEAIGKNTGWDFASLWMLNEDDDQLHYSNCWYASTAIVNNFGEASRSFSFNKGIGLPGRILESRKPLWIKDLQLENNFPRAKYATISNLHAAFAFPIQSNEKVVGVLEVLSNQIKEPDEAMLDMFESIGKMICQFILRKKAESEIKKSNDRYRDLLNNLEAGVVIHAPDTSIISCNPKGLELLGLSEAQITGKLAIDPEWKFLDENNNPLPLDKYPVNQVIASKKAVKNFIAGVNRSTNNIVWLIIHGFPVLDTKGEIIEIVISFIDITENILVEKELQKSESFLKETLRIADLGTYTIDIANGNWTASAILERILGIDAGFEKSYEGGQSLIHPEWRKTMENYLKDEVIGKRNKFDIEYKIIRHSDKVERWVHGIGDLKFDDNNNPVTLVATVQDITEIKETENLLKHKNDELQISKAKAEESDRLKSAFLANMSHEIRTPMNGILGFADLLKEPELSGHEMQEYIDIIQKSGKRMLNIINDIVDISRIESGMMDVALKESNINEQIEYTYTFFKPEVEAKGMKLFYINALPTIESIIITDREKLFAILTNLVKNAIKYSNVGEIEFGYTIKGNDFEFYVKDTGIGIPKNQLKSVFERFIQVDITNKMARQGAGLGLSITKAYVEMLGGKIWVESEEGVGSSFYFTIPFKTKLQEENKSLEDYTENHLVSFIKKLKILVCDDDEISKMFMSLAVKEICKELFKAKTGLEAVEICSLNPDLDLILMDSQMPKMNGYDATKQIRQFNNKVVIIAQTGYGMTEDRLKSIEAGCNDYISKPFGKDELLNLISKNFSKESTNY